MQQEEDSFRKETRLKFKEEWNYICSTDLYFADTWTRRKNRSEIPCKSSYVVPEKISRTDRVKNVEVLYEVKEEVGILHTVKLREAIWIGHTLRWNSFLNRLIEVGEDEDEDLSSCWMTLR
jgi:hypothetical protein